MFSQWPSWLSRSPRIRRVAIKVWRVFLRVQRATLAKAVLVVVRTQDSRVLTITSSSGELRLPTKELDGWRAVTTQVEEWLTHLHPESSRSRLLAIEGTPSRPGVTFVYSAEVVTAPSRKDAVWLDADDELDVLCARLTAAKLTSLTIVYAGKKS